MPPPGAARLMTAINPWSGCRQRTPAHSRPNSTAVFRAIGM